MDKTYFLTIYPSFEQLDIVRKTLPSVIEETRRNDAKLIVHDSSVKSRSEKWSYLREMNRDGDFFLMLTDNLSMAHARNMCIRLGQEMYAPEIICLLEDDHGYKEGFIPKMTATVEKYYGKKCSNGLRYGMFTGCRTHNTHMQKSTGNDNNFYPMEQPAWQTGRANSCCRCAPTSHWNNVLKGYDTDEYLISPYQTGYLNLRNYHKGFTVMLLENGEAMFDIENVGMGYTLPEDMRGWDDEYTASDPRSRHYKQ